MSIPNPSSPWSTPLRIRTALLSRLRPFFGLLAATVLLPLAVLGLGVWERERGAADWADLEAERLRLARIVVTLEAQAPPDGRLDVRMQFRRHGRSFVGPLALTQAREARDEAATLAQVMGLRRILPPVVIGATGLAAALSVIVLLAGAVLGRLGRTSREVLVRGFALVRRVLPALLGIQIVLGTAAFVAAVVFEAVALAQPGLGSGEIKMLLLACVVVLGSLYVAGTALAGLRRALAAFEPDPLRVLGRPVSPVEAPGLWRLVEGLAERLGALKPDAIVVGLTEGFFVSAGAKLVEPGGDTLSGRTLYVPLPYLPLLRTDELASIIGHELAHFAGGDTAYSLRFLPIYAGVGRSLDAVAAAGAGSGSAFGLLSPALRLGSFVMDRFHAAVRHWSRAREFAADAAGAGPTSPEAAVRALLRTGAIQPRIVETLDEAAERPDAAPDDLVAAVLDRAFAQGLDDPAAHLEAERPHPTDTHPPTRERIAALGRGLAPDLLAAAATVPPREALAGLEAYFADPTGLCRAVTADFLAVVRRHDEAYGAHLEATVADVGTEERVLRENMHGGAIVLAVVGALLAAAGLALAVLDAPKSSADETRLIAGLALLCGLGLGGFGAIRLRQAERVFLILRPEALAVPGLDRPIAWAHVADLDVTERRTGGMITRLLLPPEAPFPRRVPGGRAIKLDAERRIVTIMAGLPRNMRAQDFADLIGSYRRASEARRLLAERTTTPASRPDPAQDT